MTLSFSQHDALFLDLENTLIVIVTYLKSTKPHFLSSKACLISLYSDNVILRLSGSFITLYNDIAQYFYSRPFAAHVRPLQITEFLDLLFMDLPSVQFRLMPSLQAFAADAIKMSIFQMCD